MDIANIIFLTVAAITLAAVVYLNHQHQKKVMATIDERFAVLETNLIEAGEELTTELAKLREQIASGTVTPAALETLGRIETRAQNLANIIPGTSAPAPAAGQA